MLSLISTLWMGYSLLIMISSLGPPTFWAWLTSIDTSGEVKTGIVIGMFVFWSVCGYAVAKGTYDTV